MGKFVSTPEIKGERPFRCFRCSKQLALSIEGQCCIQLLCSRCKARFTIELPDPVSSALAIRAGELVKQ